MLVYGQERCNRQESGTPVVTLCPYMSDIVAFGDLRAAIATFLSGGRGKLYIKGLRNGRGNVMLVYGQERCNRQESGTPVVTLCPYTSDIVAFGDLRAAIATFLSGGRAAGWPGGGVAGRRGGRAAGWP